MNGCNSPFSLERREAAHQAITLVSMATGLHCLSSRHCYRVQLYWPGKCVSAELVVLLVAPLVSSLQLTPGHPQHSPYQGTILQGEGTMVVAFPAWGADGVCGHHHPMEVPGTAPTLGTWSVGQ